MPIYLLCICVWLQTHEEEMRGFVDKVARLLQKHFPETPKVIADKYVPSKGSIFQQNYNLQYCKYKNMLLLIKQHFNLNIKNPLLRAHIIWKSWILGPLSGAQTVNFNVIASDSLHQRCSNSHLNGSFFGWPSTKIQQGVIIDQQQHQNVWLSVPCFLKLYLLN